MSWVNISLADPHTMAGGRYESHPIPKTQNKLVILLKQSSPDMN